MIFTRKSGYAREQNGAKSVTRNQKEIAENFDLKETVNKEYICQKDDFHCRNILPSYGSPYSNTRYSWKLACLHSHSTNAENADSIQLPSPQFGSVRLALRFAWDVHVHRLP